MPAVVASVRRHAYVDSVSLLQMSSDMQALDGVQDAALVMGTDLNRELLRESGLLVDEATDAGVNDLVIAVRADDTASARRALDHAESLLTRRRRSPETANEPLSPRSLRSAHRLAPEARLALISVPGQFAANEARQALADGLHVFLFSDNVALQDEVQLKQAARERGLLLMGPDCGTAILNGVGLGFANVVRGGNIGVVGASGTGIQEVVSLVHQAGFGISQAIGTGSRDLHASVGGVTTLQAIELLREDPRTQTIVLVSKAGDAVVSTHVLDALAATGKPHVAYLQGAETGSQRARLARTLEEAACLATGASMADRPEVSAVRFGTSQRCVRGLFCGGTLCQEAAALLAEHADAEFVDFGDDEYTRGRAHPMLDPTLRNQAIVQAGRDARVAVVLLDFILGLGAHGDPVGAALPAIREALGAAAMGQRTLAILAHVVGTDADPQSLSRQEEALRAAGVHVFGSNARAASAAGQLLAAIAA